jgi:hypothetical protein
MQKKKERKNKRLHELLDNVKQTTMQIGVEKERRRKIT